MIVKVSLKIINKVAAFLKKGGVVICPTDTVYGFLADASNKKAVDRIYKIKKRPKIRPISLFVKDVAMAKQIAQINDKQTKMMRKFWPGKYTFVVNRKPNAKFYGLYKDTVAIRIPKHSFLNQVLKKINRPLSQTSVNISGKDVLDKIDDIIKQFGKSNILIIDGGNIKKGKPSKITDLTNNKNKVLRL